MIYDSFQKEAIENITKGHSVLVSAPTGAGKTVIAEYVITDCLSKNTNVIYTAPIKALSNQKFRDFSEIYKDKIGILTGDVSINSSAPVLIMTTEIFRNKVLEGESDLSKYSWIIFDEIHYIDDYERGSVWEESLIFLPKHMKVLALSATIPNIDQLADWIRSIHNKPIKTVKEVNRPVPLHFFYQYQGRLIDNIPNIKDSKNAIADYRYRRRTGPPGHVHLKPNKPTTLIKSLAENDRLPCIYFSFGRRRCEYLAKDISKFDFLSIEEKEKIKALYTTLCERFGLTGDKTAREFYFLVEKGIAYHHAGMLPTLKEVVERLFTSRLIKVIFTTETFALGINMPARTVVFDELVKFYGRYRGIIKTRDFYQMAGRAGRRGIDKEGFVYSRVSPRDISTEELRAVIYNQPEKVQSKFNAAYATILSLYERYNEKIYDIYPNSFHFFQQTRQMRDRAVKQMRAKVNILKELGYIKQNKLTQKGNFAKKIYGYELSLSEFYEKGSLEALSEEELAIFILALVFEPRKGVYGPRLSKKVGARHAAPLLNATESMVCKIQRMEKRFNVRPLSKKYFYHLTACLEAWMKGSEFDKASEYTDEDPGGLIRYFRMAIQILREILDTPVSKDLKHKCRNVIRLINRDIIDAEKQLRT